jgi:hypothetical protein
LTSFGISTTIHLKFNFAENTSNRVWRYPVKPYITHDENDCHWHRLIKLKMNPCRHWMPLKKITAEILEAKTA